MTKTDAVDDRRIDDQAPPAPAPTTPAEWDDLIGAWDEIRHGYHLGDARLAVLECAESLEVSLRGGGPDVALWTLGLTLIGPYVIHAHPDAAAEARVLAAMRAVERALGQEPCAHEAHPCDDFPYDDELDNLRYVLEMLAHPEKDDAHEAVQDDGGLWGDEGARDWYGSGMTRDVWACPRNVAGFARGFAD